MQRAYADIARSVGAQLETVRSCFLGTLDFPEPDCSLAAKRRANAFIDSSYGLTGGGVGAGNIGRPRRVVYHWIFAGVVELRGIEPLTSAVRLQRSPI